MTGEHDPLNTTKPTAAPTPGAPEGDRYASPSEPGASAGEKAQADWANRNHSDDGGTVIVGSRPIQHPTETIDEAGGEPAGEGNLYDRLSKKDQTPVDEGGSSSLA